jgi:hypothetical protein
MNNKTKIDVLHNSLSKYFNTRNNVNWKALVEAIGQEDQSVADLAENVRKQFFTKTASRPYLDKLGSNVGVNRPRFVGMEDADFKKFIPIYAYQPKQVKQIIDELLNLFFLEESTVSFAQSNFLTTVYLENEWELEYLVDGYKQESIKFKTSDFSDINSATVDEIVGAINRNALYSYAVKYVNGATKNVSVRLFTNTIGAKGSIEITGGRANISLQFEGFITEAVGDNTTQWTVTMIGDTVTFQCTGGTYPGINYLQEGDVVVVNMPDNLGSFPIFDVLISDNKFSFTNVFGTVGVFTQASSKDVVFLRPNKAVIYTKNTRAITWETTPRVVSVEMPSSPQIVKRKLKGAAHLNGTYNTMVNRTSSTSLELDDATKWPNEGSFVIQQKREIISHYGSEAVSKQFNSRLVGLEQRYSYTGKVGNLLTGITPNLPALASTVIEEIGMANSGSLVILVNSVSSTTTKIKGAYVWDLNAPFVLSSKLGTIAENINVGETKKLLTLNTNNIPETQGEVVFDFGKENQEGPVRYLFKPLDNTIVLDPAYFFKKNHVAGSGITVINARGSHNMTGNGSEYAMYLTDPIVARETLQNLILNVKSVGMFVEFLIRYPIQLYGTIDVYRSGT